MPFSFPWVVIMHLLNIKLSPDDLSRLDALVRERQIDFPEEVTSRVGVIRDLIRNARPKTPLQNPERTSQCS
jgi:hypothetical protein